ncbi:MAG: hypothetical protein HYY90_00260 [Candidatus Omnitrophica bacterium]|nr:hypothetical protein [Candidatus Omnitrophota bacterium]
MAATVSARARPVGQSRIPTLNPAVVRPRINVVMPSRLCSCMICQISNECFATSSAWSPVRTCSWTGAGVAGCDPDAPTPCSCSSYARTDPALVNSASPTSHPVQRFM